MFVSFLYQELVKRLFFWYLFFVFRNSHTHTHTICKHVQIEPIQIVLDNNSTILYCLYRQFNNVITKHHLVKTFLPFFNWFHFSYSINNNEILGDCLTRMQRLTAKLTVSWGHHFYNWSHKKLFFLERKLFF